MAAAAASLYRWTGACTTWQFGRDPGGLARDRRSPMKLLRYGPAGQEKPGLLDRDGRIRQLSGAVRDIDGEALAPASLDRLRRLDPASLPLVPGSPRLGPCVGSVSKIVAIGLKYRLHAQEAGAATPSEPIFFIKATASICRRKDDVIIPKNTQKA